MTVPAEKIITAVARLTGAVEALTADGETLTGDDDGLTANIGTLTGNVGALTFDVETLIFDVGALTFDVGALTFDVFRLKNKSNSLIFKHLRQNCENGSKTPHSVIAEGFAFAEYCLRDVRATVKLYKIWKERLAGIT